MRNAVCAILIGLVAGPAFAEGGERERERDHENLARMILERLERLEMRMKKLEQRRAPDAPFTRDAPVRRERRERPQARYDLEGLERLMHAARTNEDARAQLMRVRAAIDNALRLPGRKKEMKRERAERNREREMKAADVRRRAAEMREREMKIKKERGRAQEMERKRAEAHQRLAKMQRMVAELEQELNRLRAEAARGNKNRR